jgi:hypothetical protein
MEQRRLRLGDILDDYCPRERRLANHVVVAMIGDEVRQTRCTTCDAEHAYKGAKVPPRRKVKEPAPEATAERPRLNGDHGAPSPHAEDAPRMVAAAHPAPEPDPEPAAPPASQETDADVPPALVEGPVHRPLIRATLPRVEGEVKERPIPEFTMRMARPAGRGQRSGGGRPGQAGKGGGRGARQAANFRPGVMSSWSPSNPRPRAGDPQQAGRPQNPRGNKKSR